MGDTDKALINTDFNGFYIYVFFKILSNSGIISICGNIVDDKKIF